MTLKDNIVYKTRNGKKVHVIRTGFPNFNGYTAVAVLYDFNKLPWQTVCYRPNGQYGMTYNNMPHDLDIVSYWNTSIKVVLKE